MHITLLYRVSLSEKWALLTAWFTFITNFIPAVFNTKLELNFCSIAHSIALKLIWVKFLQSDCEMEYLQIRDSRDKLSEPRPGEDEMADRDRQPSLRGFTPEWDLKLFLEAQSAASEKIVSKITLCFLPPELLLSEPTDGLFQY